MPRPKKIKAKGRPGRKPKGTAAIVERAQNKANAQSKALFLDHHLPAIARQRDAAKSAQAKLRNLYKAAKADGFLKTDFDIAFLLQTQMGERQIVADIARKAQVGKWLKRKIGDQLDLFLQQDDTSDIEAEAYVAGEEASRANKPAEPPLPAGEPAFSAYLRGYNEQQENGSGSSSAKKLAARRYEPSSGVPMTRSQFRAQQQAASAKRQAAKYVSEQESREAAALFSKRSDPDEAAE